MISSVFEGLQSIKLVACNKKSLFYQNLIFKILHALDTEYVGIFLRAFQKLVKLFGISCEIVMFSYKVFIITIPLRLVTWHIANVYVSYMCIQP